MPRDLPLEAGNLFRFIIEKTGADFLTGARVSALPGGAVLRHERLDFQLCGGAFAGPQSWVLRTEGATRLGIGLTRAQEFSLQRTLFKAGLAVAEPLFMCCDEEVLGAPFYLMRRCEGVALGDAIVGEGENEALATALGKELARLHTLDLRRALQFLGVPPGDAAAARLTELERHLAADDDPHPAAEFALRWLAREKPAPAKPVLCHGDFRTGNYLVEAGALAGVLDWDFARWSDPDEDIGWFCSKHWRFGARAREAGGIASRAAFYQAYEAVGGRSIVPRRIRYWEVMASLRWLVIALKQRDRFLRQGERSLDLALTGRRVAECELEILVLTAGGMSSPPLLSQAPATAPGSLGGEGARRSDALRDRPSGVELSMLAREIGGGDPLAARCAEIASREREGEAAAFATCRARLAARYEAADDRTLLARFADDIRAGAFDAAGAARDWARAVMTDITVQKLRESNPEFLAANRFEPTAPQD